MYPVYRDMDSYPQPRSHPRNHFSYPYHNYPNWEATPPQMKIDPSESPMNFKAWPYNTSTCFGYPNPAESHSGCNHSYPSGFYSFRPPHSYPMPPPPLFYHGPYPPYPDAFPACFIPPHYSAEKGQYEHDKGMGRYHCCGCPNHTCNGKVESNVRIEEERHDIEHKDGNGSVGMTKPQGQHYPIVWVPSDHVKEKQNSKHPEPTDPKARNGWVPFDLNGIKRLMQGEKEKGNENQQTEDTKMSHFPFPIIWMPGYDNDKDIRNNHVKDINVGPNPAAESPKFKIIPVKLLENGERGEKPGIAGEVLEGADLSPTTEKETKAKSNPPEKVEESTENKSKTNSRSAPVKRVEEKRGEETSDENGEKKRSDDNGKKESKLRPVCLRVDPLPKKKNGNGISRSPSLPGVKDAGRHGSKPEEAALSKANEGESKKKETKVIKVQDKKAATTNESKQPPKPNDVVQANQGESKKKEVKVVHVQEKSKGTLDANAAEVTREEITVRRKELSEDDAAILIQSAYRGFEVRKWEPLKKMRQIAKVRDQTGDVRERVLCLETCNDQQQCEKQRLIIGEIIMNLLLQLDAIQGLHPSVRDVRKSVAKELVCLQEKLDSLVSRNAAGLIPTSAEAARLEITSDDHSEHVRDVNSSMLRSEPISNPVASVSAPTVSHSDTAEEAAEQLTEMLETKMKETKSAMENGVPDGAIGGPADPLQLVNECQNSAPEKSSRLELEKNDERDSAVEGSIRFTKRDEDCDSGVEMLMLAEIAPAQKVEEPALKEFSEPPSERDYKAESLAKPSDASEKMNSMTEECERTPAKDSNGDSAMVGSVKMSERDGESHLGIRKPLMEAAPNVKDEETGSKADVVTEVPSSQNEEFESEPTAKAVGNVTSELPAVQDESAEELPSFSENNTGVDSVAGGHAHQFGLVERDAYASLKDVKKVEGGSERMELEIKGGGETMESENALFDTEGITVAENVGDKALEVEVAENGLAEAFMEPVEVGAVNPPSSYANSGVHVTMVRSPVSETAEPSATQAEWHGPVMAEAHSIEVKSPTIEAEFVSSGTIDVVAEIESPPANSSDSASEGSVVGKDAELRKQDEESMAETHNLKEMLEKSVEVGAVNPPSSYANSGGHVTMVRSPVSETAEPPATQAEWHGPVMAEAHSIEVKSPKIEAEFVSSGTIDVVAEIESPPANSSDSASEGSVVGKDTELRKQDGESMAETHNLKEMLEKLIEAGKQQLTVISDLNGRVRDLERKLSRKKKMKSKRSLVVRPSCIKEVDDRVRWRAAALRQFDS